PASGFPPRTRRPELPPRSQLPELFFPCNRPVQPRPLILPDRARSDFHKSQCRAVVADEIDFALNAARSVISPNEYVSLPPQIPVGIGFSANAGTAGLELFGVTGRILLFAQTAPRRPMQRLKHQI